MISDRGSGIADLIDDCKLQIAEGAGKGLSTFAAQELPGVQGCDVVSVGWIGLGVSLEWLRAVCGDGCGSVGGASERDVSVSKGVF